MLRTDLKIFKSERMTQQADAGGQRTSNEVLNGQLNEVFGNISDIDHAQSAVDIVKIYPAVSTDDTALLQDGHILINEPPLDTLVDVMIIESAAVNDGSTRADIISAIESSVVPSLLLRSGLSAMVAGQDQLSTLDLTANAGVGEQPSVTLTPNRVYVISVEYTGAESATYPRFTHFVKVTQVGAGFYRFEPPLPYNTPPASLTINAQTRCTKLRDITAGAGVVYHGVTQLTADAAGTTLQVENTIGRVTPNFLETVERDSNSPFAATEQGLVRKIVTLPAVGATYETEIADFISLVGYISTNVNSDVPFVVRYISDGRSFGNFFYEDAITGTTLTFSLPRLPDPGTDISISYYSSERYQVYSNAVALPAGYTVLLKTIRGTVYDNARALRYAVYLGNPSTNLMARWFVGSTAETALAASINAATGEITYFNDYSDLQYTAVLESNTAASDAATSCYFVMPFDSVQPASFYMSVSLVAGGLLSASGDSAGVVTGVSVTGAITRNIVNLTFAEPVVLSTLQYSINELVELLPPTNLYGINPLRLPNGGAVQLYRPFGVICVSDTIYQDAASLPAAQVINVRPNSFVDIVDSTGSSMWHPLNSYFEYDKETGEVTIVDASSFTAPFELIDTLSELALVTAVTDTTLKIARALDGDFPAGAIVSSVYQLGDLQARVTNIFDQTTWNGVWSDVIVGDPAPANFNSIAYPIEVANESTINERWAIVFVSDTAFRCVGQNVGQIATFDVENDFAPINPATNQPYFIIRDEAWGGGWQPGNVVRFNTVAASKPAVLLRSVSAGHSAIDQDSIRLHFRGNAQ